MGGFPRQVGNTRLFRVNEQILRKKTTGWFGKGNVSFPLLLGVNIVDGFIYNKEGRCTPLTLQLSQL